MPKRWKIAALLVVAGILVVVVPRLWGGKSDASSLYGGSLEPVALGDFPKLDPNHWVNGAPLSLSRARGSVVLIEAWHPA